MLNCIPVLCIPCGVWQQRADAGEAPAEEPAPSPPPLEPWEVEDGPTGDELQVIAGSEERLRARLAGKARQLSQQRAHREMREPVGGANDRLRRGGDGAVEGGAAGRGEPAHGGGRKRPPQGGAERPGRGGADGEDDRGRPTGGAAGGGGSAADGGDGGGGGTAGRRRARRKRETFAGRHARAT